MIRCKGWLIEAAESKSCFVDPSGIRHKNPVRCSHLRPGVNVGQELPLQFSGVLYNSRILTKEVEATERASRVDDVIDLAHGVLCSDGVWKAQGDYILDVVIGGKQRGKLFADGAYRHTRCLHTRDRVWDAGCWISLRICGGGEGDSCRAGLLVTVAH